LPVIKLIVSTAGIVNPMVAKTEPSRMLTERCNWLRTAARTALIASGARIRIATKKPLNTGGAFRARVP